MISDERMAHLGEWSRFNNQGEEFPRAESFPPSCTMISVGGMAQLGECSTVINQGQLFMCLRRIVQMAHG
jgi:hypothetical protein